jgi:hypothetical protein
MLPEELEQLADEIQRMDRRMLLAQLTAGGFDFDLDFTDDYLNQCSVNQLRHILMAARLHAQHR